ncbi:MAG: hypothetical protein ACXV7G_11055 [Halobacteriota archaeon]
MGAGRFNEKEMNQASDKTTQSPLFPQKTPKNSGLGEIRTLGPRRVKAMDLEHAAPYSHPSVVPFDGSVGAITIKKASAPLYIV